MTLSDKQKQLLLTAMDAGATANEAAVAATLFFRSFKTEYKDGYALLAALTGKAETDRSIYGGTILPFKKYCGKRLDEVPVDYLLWLLDNVDTMNRSLRRAIERFLQDSQYSN